MEALTRIRRDSRGQDLIEYALLAALLAVSAGAFLGGVAESLTPMFSQVASVLSTCTTWSSAEPQGGQGS